MKFEFDPAKSAVNKQKHGINFEEARALWSDPNLLEAPTFSTDEQRYLVVGLIGSKHWSAITPYRDEHVRLISVRRARRAEIEHYESQ